MIIDLDRIIYCRCSFCHLASSCNCCTSSEYSKSGILFRIIHIVFNNLVLKKVKSVFVCIKSLTLPFKWCACNKK